MPEKTRDRKNWFPRFKSNWLGTYRSKQMFLCCECAVTDAESARYKGAEGKHCACGRDQWHLAKSVEEAEYNRRMEISKSFGGIRYEEAVERIKGMGGSAAVNGEYTTELDDHRVRCGSDESSASTMSVHSSDSVDFGHHAHKRIKTETQSLSPTSRSGAFAHELKLSMGSNAYGYDHHQLNQPQPYKSYHSSSSNNSYAPLPADTMLSSSPYDHLAPPAFTDEESFGELLQGILEDDPRNPHNSHHAKMASHGARAAPYQPYSHMKRYAEPLATQQQTQAADMDFGYYQNSGYQNAHHHHHHTQSQQQTSHHGYSGYHQPHSFHHHQHMVPPVATASFPSAV